MPPLCRPWLTSSLSHSVRHISPCPHNPHPHGSLQPPPLSPCGGVCVSPSHPCLCVNAELPAPGPSISVTGHEFRKPIIWVSPSRVVALGGSVTIRCEGQDPGMTFFLHKAGHLNLQRQMVPDGPVAEFPIPSIGREDGGNYTCDYQSITDQNRWSNLSDPIEIIVAGEGYPKPSISISPRWGVSLGGAVTVRCWGQRQDMRFMLNKEGRHFPPVDSDGFEAEFSSSNVRREYGGSYSCSYHSRSEPFTMSYPSDPMELVVRGEGPGSASLFPAPGPAGCAGAPYQHATESQALRPRGTP
uniref:Ig-like domain-containing protein n=1 Tax=Chelonoidis abingdonii TaxID=106734 RepID=A0A8C0H776_CHEAB